MQALPDYVSTLPSIEGELTGVWNDAETPIGVALTAAQPGEIVTVQLTSFPADLTDVQSVEDASTGPVGFYMPSYTISGDRSTWLSVEDRAALRLGRQMQAKAERQAQTVTVAPNDGQRRKRPIQLPDDE